MRSEPEVTKDLNGKVKKRVKPPPVRARRRLIDPTKWDSVYLKGVFLDAVPVLLSSRDALERPSVVTYDIMDEEDEEETSHGTDGGTFSPLPQHPRQLAEDPARTVQSVQHLPEATIATSSSRIDEATECVDPRGEANAALAMLEKMFGDKEDWDGRESFDEMEGIEDDQARDKEMQVDEEDDIEIVPRNLTEGERRKTIQKDKGKGKEKMAEDVVDEDEVDVTEALDRDLEMEEDGPPVDIEVSAQTAVAELAPRTDLKTLFAPKEDGLSDAYPCMYHF